ncbi:MAG: lipid-binding protein [Bacteroidia bacterium]|nr:lipid-binding protein [Bacteroidia bacterium]
MYKYLKYAWFRVNITDGKILPGAGHQNNGSVADSISFYVVFSDDDYIGNFYSKLHVAGVRYSGLAEND